MSDAGTGLAFRLAGADVLLPDGIVRSDLHVVEGWIAETGGRSDVRVVDLSGWIVCPGIVDIHGDGFERHVAARRGALTDLSDGLVSTEAELAANGITTAMLAQFWSWEGGMRGPDFAARLAAAWRALAPGMATDLRLQLRLETSMVADFPAALRLIDRIGIGYVVFNDHLPHDHLEAGKAPPRLTGSALRAGRSPEAHLALMRSLHAGKKDGAAALAGLAAALAARDVRIGSHDDATAASRAFYHGLGVRIAEFPETREAAVAARESGDAIVMGAPNVVRGSSHAGKVSARDVIAAGLCDALASDYHYPSLRRAVVALEQAGICDFATAWRLISDGPARLLGLDDRGRLTPGRRADLVILDRRTGQVGAAMAGGRFTFLRTPLAERFLG